MPSMEILEFAEFINVLKRELQKKTILKKKERPDLLLTKSIIVNNLFLI
jgi:hypothetical protein